MNTEAERFPDWTAQERRSADFTLRVWGDRGAFKRYDTPAEAQTYPMLTVPAACAILRSIYWHPGVEYDVTRISVLNPVRIYTVLTNEVSGHAREQGLDITARGVRSQRYREVIDRPAYLISARIVLSGNRTHEEYREAFGKTIGILMRRIRLGQCHERPYLGQREYAANFELGTQDDVPWNADANLGPVPLQLHLVPSANGPLKFERYGHDAQTGEWIKVSHRGMALATYMQGVVEGGVMEVPDNFGPGLGGGA